MQLELHPEALEEYAKAVAFYEEQRPGLGGRFIQSVESAFEIILESSNRWPILELDIRRYLTRVFPYAILYTVEPTYVLVVAVMHCHQRPGYWRPRLWSPK